MGRWRGGTIDGDTAFTLDGGSTGSFQSNELGFGGSTSFSHTRASSGTLTFHEDGTRSADYPPVDSLNRYFSAQSSLQTTADVVGGSSGELDLSSLTTVSGGGTTGTSSASSQGTYTQGNSTETYTYGPSTSAVPLSGPPLEAPTPYLFEFQVAADPLTPAGTTGLLGTGGVGCLSEGAPGGVVGLVAGRLEAPTFGGYTALYLGTPNNWRLALQPQGTQLLSVQPVPTAATPPEIAWLGQGTAGAGLPANSWDAWTFLSTTGQVWLTVSYNYDQSVVVEGVTDRGEVTTVYNFDVEEK